eukprot:4974600-Amphidinium_carterae.1
MFSNFTGAVFWVPGGFRRAVSLPRGVWNGESLVLTLCQELISAACGGIWTGENARKQFWSA